MLLPGLAVPFFLSFSFLALALDEASIQHLRKDGVSSFSFLIDGIVLLFLFLVVFISSSSLVLLPPVLWAIVVVC